MSKLGPRQVIFSIIESKCGVISTPWYTQPSSRTPAPLAGRYATMRPVSGRKSLAGFSAVTRHCIAQPRRLMLP